MTGVGEELSRGHRDFEPFKHNPVGKVEPKRLLGFLAVVRIMFIPIEKYIASNILLPKVLRCCIEGNTRSIQAERSVKRTARERS